MTVVNPSAIGLTSVSFTGDSMTDPGFIALNWGVLYQQCVQGTTTKCSGAAGNQTADLLARCTPSGIIPGAFDPGVTPDAGASVTFVLIGANDWVFNTNTGAQAFANVVAVCSYLLARGSQPRVLTSLPGPQAGSWSAARETQRLNYNTLVTGSLPAGCRALNVEVYMGNGASPNVLRTGYYSGSSGDVHPTTAGMLELAWLAATL